MVHVYNNAGHSATAMTSEFIVPSIYPPGHGIIVDLDPENADVFSDDVDIHFTENVMCASWTGFSHTEHVSFEAGIGTIGESDNILAFGNVQKGTNMYCLNSKSIKANSHLVFLVRVNGTGGSNIAVSNGLRIYNKDILQKTMKIRVGRDCFHFQPVIMTVYLIVAISVIF
ncbi:hypothetical protein DPMN_175842 [Dreissena polymorpha]|uniref:Uncharacterized protein n=1 Tax=Dreissena polymorpha TaxID=45954 RepID=A0A9D4E8J2_DREPO|nr:hypothetical protein DPMN_175842 [Dreissena polymorpha]